jgi:hypothetical protein
LVCLTCFSLVTEANVSEVVKSLRQEFDKGTTLPYEFRLKQLKSIKQMFDENKDEIIKVS